MSNIDIHYPGSPVRGFSEDDVRRLVNLGCAFETPDGVSFVGPGFFSLGNRLSIVLPRPYQGSDGGAPVLNAAHVLMSALMRYQSRRQRAVGRDDGSVLSFGEFAEASTLARLSAALELVAEEAEYGPFIMSTSQKAAGGRVNWSRTIREGAPVGGVHGEVFTSVVASRVRPDPSHPLCAAHRQTLEASRAILTAATESAPLASKVLRVLDFHEGRLFSDRAKRLSNLMRRFHAGGDSKQGHSLRRFALFFARSFEHV